MKYARLPPQREAEEIRRAKDAKILVRVVEAEGETAPRAVHESAAEGETLQALLVIERGLRALRVEAVGPRVAVAAPQCKAEIRAAELIGHPLAAERESGLVVVRLVEVAQHGQAVVLAREDVVRQPDPERGRQREVLGQ